MAKKQTKKAAAKAAPAKKQSASVKKANKKQADELTEEEQEEQDDKPVKKGKEEKAALAKGKKKLPTGVGNPEKTYQHIKDLVAMIDEDIDKFLVNETRAAGRRIRGYAQSIRKACQVLRKEIQGVANERKAQKK
jgi:hypothetical protein